ncbi:hypothetical protein [Aquiflexum sp.]|uniref:hypothetical protein n=1 Tax=Aquiflexum sp. TaxID=1872584 RepID=UPI00359432DF
MKNLITRIFTLAVIVFVLFQIQNLTAQTLAPFPAKYSFVNVSEIGELKNSYNSVQEVIIPSLGTEYASSHFLPIPFEGLLHSFEKIGFGKNHLVMISIFLSAFFLVISHKNKFETEIYEFYHRTPSGEVLFENVEVAKTHEFKSFIALSMKIMGMITGLIAIFLIVY